MPSVPARDPRIEAYLDQVVARLPRDMSPASRQAERGELAAHLDALVAAHVELGVDEDTAVLAALHEFGDARRLGKRLAGAWERVRGSEQISLGAGVVVSGAFLAFLLLFPVFLSNDAQGLPGYPTVSLGPAPVGFWFDLALPCVSGFLWGHYRLVGARWWGVVVVPALLAAAILPFASALPSDALLELMARSFLLMKWGMGICSAAGFTVTLRLLREHRERPQIAG
jgi:hypothetical protein